jgi:hypothetical protein
MAILFAFGSCTKKASDMIVGHWTVDTIMWHKYYQGSIADLDYTGLKHGTVWEFDSNGTLRFMVEDEVYKGSYSFIGPQSTGSSFSISDINGPDVQMCGIISRQFRHELDIRWMSDDYMLLYIHSYDTLPYYTKWFFTHTDRFISDVAE